MLSPILLSFFHVAQPAKISTLSLHDALPILSKMRASSNSSSSNGCSAICRARSALWLASASRRPRARGFSCSSARSEEHTSELQSQSNLVCRLLLEKKKYYINSHKSTSQSTP